jgi:hypothetical protein
MRRLTIVFLLFLSVAAAEAQDKTIHRGAGEMSHFGAPVVKYTMVKNQAVLMFGGRGGWNVTPSLCVGGGLYATMTEIDGPDSLVPYAPGPLDIKFESFGFELEYAPRPAAPTHPTFYAFFGGAADHYMRDKTREQHGETDFMLLFEPAVGVERRIANWLHLNLAMSYRLVRGVEQPLLKDADFNGPAVALAFKFGRF